jgi:hypothetical protein
MRNFLSKISIFSLLICQLILKSSRDKLVSQFNYNEISINEEKSQEETSVKKKSIKNASIIKIMRTKNAFSTNMLMFCDSKYESKSSISSLFVRLKNIKSRLIFLFFDFYFSV